MKSSGKLPSMSTINDEWLPTSWHDLAAGDFVAVTVANQVVLCGDIDVLTVDKSIAWIYPNDSSERRMCFLEDGPRVWLPPANPTDRSISCGIGVPND